ncbi:MAG: protein kinase [bacterium]
MSSNSPEEARRLFDVLFALDRHDRDRRLRDIAAEHDVAREVESLLAAAGRSGDFLGLLGDGRSPSSPQADDVVLGRYQVQHRLGSGAMGDVHLAWDMQLERPVALKFLRTTHASTDAASVARLRAEARAAARIDHPHIATVYDTGATNDGRLFIAMAFYPGDTLRERMDRGPVPLADVLRIGAQVAGALAAAHAAGIVHRDVKPANVLFDAEGGARLTDFGIARLLTDPEATGPSPVQGTPAYMAPEQARGDSVDGRADLWALGVMLHEMLTGRRPQRDTPDSALPDVADDAERALRTLVAQLLVDDPARRASDAGVVRDALGAIVVALASDALPRRTDVGRGSLPTVLSTFVGREREMEETRAFLAGTRLLTLVGPGGTGKTRLALALATIARPAHGDGAWFVPLADIASAALVPSAIAEALGVRDLGTSRLADRVLATFGERQLLLVLDNFEHVLAAAPFVSSILASCPRVTVLATSRAPLGVQGEQVYPLSPLGTPTHDAVNLADNDSVRLFVARARAVRPNFALDDDSLAVVAEICRRLDGLPLALELAAARATLLSPRAILARLEQRFDLLRAEGGDRPARHGTMRAVMEWSFILLTDEERGLFCRLAVFAGGASLEAADVVGNRHTQGTDVRSVLDLVTSLASKSLIHVEEQPDGEPRLLMLETVRQFGLDRLASGSDAITARRAHRAWSVSLAERGAERMRGPEQAEWLDRFEREYANFRVAFDSGFADPADGLQDCARLAIALHRLWLIRGPLFEGIGLLARLRAAFDAADAPVLPRTRRAQLLTSAAHLAGSRSVFPEARELFANALPLYREAGDRAGTAATLNNLAWQVWNVGDLAAGEAMSLEAMELHRQLGDELGVALSRNNLAWIAVERGDFRIAEAHFDAVIASHRKRNDARSAAFAMSWLGVVVAKQGDYARAMSLQEQAMDEGATIADNGFRTLALVRLAGARHALGEPGQTTHLANVLVPTLREMGRLWPLAHGLAELGSMFLDADEPMRARPVLEEALAARSASGSEAGVTETRMLLAVALLRLGDRPSANALLREAIVAARRYGAPPLVAACIEAVAFLALDVGLVERAAELLAVVWAVRARLGMRASLRQAAALEARRRAMHDVLGADRWHDAEARGAASTLEDAVRGATSALDAMTAEATDVR